MSDREPPPYFARPVYRAVGAAFGLLLVGIASYLLFAWSGPRDGVAAALLMTLGGNQLLAAWRGTRSWLARLGPLP